MFSGTSSDDTHERKNDLYDHQIQMQRTWDLNKIGNFDEDSWINIFQYLNSVNLANVATVCKQFKTLAQNVFKKRSTMRFGCHAGECAVFVEANRIGWKSIICRFRNCITRISFEQDLSERARSPYSEGVLRFMDEFLSESSLKSVSFVIDPKQFQNFTFSKTFHNLEELALFNVSSVFEHTVMTTINRWCPNLKSLVISDAEIHGPHFFFQSMPSLKCLKLNNVILHVTTGYIMDFFTANNQLKELAIENVTTLSDEDMSWLTVANEQLTDLGIITLATNTTNTLDCLPEFRHEFINLKSLSFLMAGYDRTCCGTLTNQLLRIINHVPKIERLRVINCRENLMTNDDLVELIGQSSLTLQLLEITGYDFKRNLKFGYDLHRQIFGTATRSALRINFDFGDAFSRLRNLLQGKKDEMMEYKITKDGIWENEKLIVLASKSSNM